MVSLAARGAVTAGARKLYDILRSLPEDAEVSLEAKENRMTVRAGKSRFNLQTLAAADFPRMVEAKDASKTLTLPQKALKEALGLVQFAMAVQDIRYYLNGVLFSVDKDTLRVVATDGHRLSFASQALGSDHGSVEAILPRKTVIELIKLLSDTDEPVALAMNIAHGDTRVIEAITRQAEKYAYCHPALSNQPRAEVCARIARLAPGNLNTTYLCSGGSEAVETAIKIARQYHLARGHGAARFIDREEFEHDVLAGLGAFGVGLEPRLFA